MSEQFITYPILYQALLAILLLFFWNKTNIQRIISVIGSLGGLVLSGILFNFVWRNGIQSVQMGGWEAPFGISIVADTFSVTLVLLTHIVALSVSLFSTFGIVSSRMKFGYFSIFHLMIMGLCGAFLTGDIFNLYVWFEVIIISSFVLLTIGGKKAQLEGAVKYFTLNMLASIIFLTAIALLYGVTGTLNMAHLAQIIPNIADKGLIEIIGLIFLIAFGVKAGIFPLYFWLPASYHTPPSAVSALFGGLLTKLGIYALIRVFTLLFPSNAFDYTIIEIVAMLTILAGAVGAFVQKDILKAFSYLIICHIGFMLAGLSLNTEVALIGAIFYMIHDIVVKANIFLVGGVLHRITGSTEYTKMGGIMDSYPKLAILFAIPLFSLVGIPPLSGFWPKLSLFSASFATESYGILFFLLFGSFMTLVIIARIWLTVFSKKLPKHDPQNKIRLFSSFSKQARITLLSAIGILACVSLFIGFSAETIQIVVERIVKELTFTETYINHVLQNGTPIE
jgi:multicomponent Na+:H+ antiporter subunit D